MMLCPNCRTDNDDRQKFCTQCGHPLALSCPRCQAAILSSYKFCGACGLKLEGAASDELSLRPAASEGERKHVTVLFSDLAGYTRLAASRDPEEVRDLSSRIFAEIAGIVSESRGFIEKFVGDAVLAIFGLPAVHEDDPMRAVQAALEIHRFVYSMPVEKKLAAGHRLRMHSGIHTGLVVTGEMVVEKGVHGIVGDTLNLASRLADIARPGEILISPQTQRLIASYFETRPLAAVKLKGIAGRITPYRVVGRLDIQSRFEAAKQQGFSTFTGRRGELHNLQRCLEKTLQGNGQFVTITGEAGMGKSRLAYEFCHGIDRGKVTLLQGRCQPYGNNTPYLPILGALRRYLAPPAERGGEDPERWVIERVLAIDPALEQYLPLYLHLLTIPSRSYPFPGHLAGQTLKNALNQALSAMLLFNARHQPTILVLEDWHWVDDASDSSLMHLAGLMDAYPLMVLVSYRPERTAGWPDWHFHTACVLKALDRRGTEHIIRSNWNVAALPDGLAAFVHDHTGGNPLFIEEVARTLIEEGSVRITGRQAELLGSPERLNLPATVQAIIRARLDRLAQPVKKTLQLAAVIGRRFPVRILERLVDAGHPLSDALALLQTQGLIQLTDPVPEAAYTFKHALTQLTVYESLLVKKRRQVHAQIGRILETLYADRLGRQCEHLAYHYANSTDSAKALHYLEMAGDKATRVHSLPEARRYFETALTILGDAPQTVQQRQRYIDFALKWAEVAQYAPSNSVRHALVQSLEYAEATEVGYHLAEVSYWVGKFGYMQGDFVDAIPRVENSIRLAETLGHHKLHGLSTNLRGRACLYTCDFAGGIRRIRKGLELIAPFDVWDDTVYSTAIMGIMLGLTGNFRESLRTIAQAIQTARRHVIPTFAAMAFGYLGAVHYWYGNWQAAINNCDKCIAVSQRLGNPLPIIWGTMFRGAAIFDSGAREAGLDVMARAIEMFTHQDSVLALRYFYALYGESLALSGRCREAESTLNKAMALRQSGQHWGEMGAYRAQAILLAAEQTTDWPRVDEAMLKSIAMANRSGATTELMLSLVRYADLLQRKGDCLRANDCRRQARELTRRTGCRRCHRHDARTDADVMTAG